MKIPLHHRKAPHVAAANLKKIPERKLKARRRHPHPDAGLVLRDPERGKRRSPVPTTLFIGVSVKAISDVITHTLTPEIQIVGMSLLVMLCVLAVFRELGRRR